ncbi:tRNA dihydrouridine synthase DusB [Pelovirga terrestris]|uniref:tRNA-dihydrouridine synthase n=1 Tax=Pelovirga terrestris TaxID=2771352 RepID=A0A8J6QWP1_9BACT|nr:tRNA dihydrouridine synthase DusB [Pelovirga terrestris]MBD1400101.1 tRNA dihydrouridine synthase DusB [Pelovirga terrestris]
MQTKPLTIQSLTLTSPIILAPMAGISNLPYRRIMKSCGAGLVFSEMVSANGLIRDGARTQQLLATHPEESPLGIQLFGSDPQVLAEAASRLPDVPDLIDLNMGCPVKKVIRSGSGSALLQNPGLIARILKAVRRCVSGPLTIKIRSGWDIHHMNFLEIGHIAQEEGVDAITLHPRTRCQGFTGRADWKQIGELKQALRIPVFGSGDMMTVDDGLRMHQETGCDGLMIGRGGYGNPWLIKQLNDALQGNRISYPTAADKLAIILRHLELHREQFGEHKALLEMRKHISWYARGMEGAGHLRSELQSCQQLPQLVALTEHFFQQDHHR